MTWSVNELSTRMPTLLSALLALLLIFGLRYLWLLYIVKRKEEGFAKQQAEVNRLYREEDYLVRMHTELAALDERGRRSWLQRMRQTI